MNWCTICELHPVSSPAHLQSKTQYIAHQYPSVIFSSRFDPCSSERRAMAYLVVRGELAGLCRLQDCFQTATRVSRPPHCLQPVSAGVAGNAGSTRHSVCWACARRGCVGCGERRVLGVGREESGALSLIDCQGLGGRVHQWPHAAGHPWGLPLWEHEPSNKKETTGLPTSGWRIIVCYHYEKTNPSKPWAISKYPDSKVHGANLCIYIPINPM